MWRLLVEDNMGNFYTDVLMKDPRFHSPDKCADIMLLEPGFRAKMLHFVSLAEAARHHVSILETYRSRARQLQLWTQHATELKEVGVHGYGLACDFALYVNGVYDPKGQDYMSFVALAQADDVLSGINWGEPHEAHGFKDYDHLQGVPLFRQAALFAGTWYPTPDYSPWADEQAHGVS